MNTHLRLSSPRKSDDLSKSTGGINSPRKSGNGEATESPRGGGGLELYERWRRLTTVASGKSVGSDPMTHRTRIQNGVIAAIRSGQSHYFAFRLHLPDDVTFMPASLAILNTVKRNQILWCPSEMVRDTLSLALPNDCIKNNNNINMKSIMKTDRYREEQNSGYLLVSKFNEFIQWLSVQQQCGWLVCRHENNLGLMIVWHPSSSTKEASGDTLFTYSLQQLSPVPDEGYLNRFEQRIRRAQDAGQTQACLCLLHLNQSYYVADGIRDATYTVSETRELFSGVHMWAVFSQQNITWCVDKDKFEELITWITIQHRLRWSLRFQCVSLTASKITSLDDLQPQAVLIATWIHI